MNHLMAKLRKNKELIMVLLSAFILRLIFVLLDSKLGLLPYDWDVSYYHHIAMHIKDNLLAGRAIFTAIDVSTNVAYYSLFVACVYLLPGLGEINIRIVNSLIAILALWRLYTISLNLYNKRAAMVTLLLASFFPSLFLYSSLNMRESLLILFMMDLIYRFILKAKLSKRLSYILIDFIFLTMLRKQNLFLLIGILFIYGCYLIYRRAVYRQKKWFIAFFFLLLILTLLIMQSGLIPLFNIDFFSSEMETRTRGGGSYLEWMKYNTVLDIMKYIPLRLLYFSFGPLPWDISSSFMLFASIEGFIIFILFAYWVFNIFYGRFNWSKEKVFLLIVFLLGLAANAAIDANYGTSQRHRVNYIIILFIFISPYLCNLKAFSTVMKNVRDLKF